MKIRTHALALLFVAACAWTAAAQFVYPPDLPDRLKIQEIREWTITKVDGNYMADILVVFENSSDYNVVLREPVFDVDIIIEEKRTIGHERSVIDDGAKEPRQVIRPIILEPGQRISLGRAELPEGRTDLTIAAQRNDEPAIVEQTFVMNLGPASIETADKLLLRLFNTVASQRDTWSSAMNGSARVGITGASGTTVFSREPIDIEIRAKPPVRLDTSL